jgi:hypothetical protein
MATMDSRWRMAGLLLFSLVVGVASVVAWGLLLRWW